ncbi:MAG: hypothetical protein ACK5PF_07225 [bacterium]|jgi:hypothetical protein
MSMTRKHFTAIANVLKANVDYQRSIIKQNEHDRAAQGALLALSTVATELGIELRNHNPQFHPQTFLEACGF